MIDVKDNNLTINNIKDYSKYFHEMIVECPKDTRIKYEYDFKNNLIKYDRLLSFDYPYNYGFIRNTISPDNDPLDVILLEENILYPGSLVDILPVAKINMIDSLEEDNKIVAIPKNNFLFYSKNKKKYKFNTLYIKNHITNIKKFLLSYKKKGLIKINEIKIIKNIKDLEEINDYINSLKIK